MNVEGAEDNDTDGDLAVVISVPEVVPVVVVHLVRAEMQQFAFQTSEVHVASRRGSSQTEADHRFFVQLLAGTGTAVPPSPPPELKVQAAVAVVTFVVSVDAVDVLSDGQAVHTGSALATPAADVYLPAAHGVCAVHWVAADAVAVNLPLGQTVHPSAALFKYLPTGHGAGVPAALVVGAGAPPAAGVPAAGVVAGVPVPVAGVVSPACSSRRRRCGGLGVGVSSDFCAMESLALSFELSVSIELSLPAGRGQQSVRAAAGAAAAAVAEQKSCHHARRRRPLRRRRPHEAGARCRPAQWRTPRREAVAAAPRWPAFRLPVRKSQRCRNGRLLRGVARCWSVLGRRSVPQSDGTFPTPV